jgi:hypothetical protein
MTDAHWSSGRMTDYLWASRRPDGHCTALHFTATLYCTTLVIICVLEGMGSQTFFLLLAEDDIFSTIQHFQHVSITSVIHSRQSPVSITRVNHPRKSPGEFGRSRLLLPFLSKLAVSAIELQLVCSDIILSNPNTENQDVILLLLRNF